jgi:hypothetical protein
MKKLAVLLGVFGVLVANRLRADSTLVFNEIMYHPGTDEPTMEWIEFRNQLAVDLDLSGWSVSGGVEYTFASNTIVRGRGFLVLAIAPEIFMDATGLTNVLGPFTGRLSNDGEELRIRNNNGRLVDSIDYGVDGDWPVGPDGSGVSLAKRDRETASAPAENWTVSEQVGGTPGADNFPLVGAAIPDVPLIIQESEWKYEGSGQDLGSTWRAADYSDAGWSSGQAWLYHGNITTGQPRPITTLFSTGIGTNGVALTPGARDPHYIITAAAQGTLNTNAIAMENHPAWLGNDTSSVWINAVVNSGLQNVNAGGYNYLTTFRISGFNPGTVQVLMNIAADDQCTNVLLNGTLTGISVVGFATFSPTFTLTSGLLEGDNTLEFRTVNGGTGPNPAGFRAFVRGSGMVTTTNTALQAGSTAYYFRKGFVYPAENDRATLRLRALVDDGAVFYLNGVEIHRINMPAGAIDHSTAASSDVTSPLFTGFISVPAEALEVGTNVLAVEVHQAAGGSDDLLFDAELIATPLPADAVTLTINEHAPAGEEFWLELINPGTNALDLTDVSIVRDGAVPAFDFFIFPSGTTLAANSFLVVTNTTLGFIPAPGDKIYLFAAQGTTLHDAIVVGDRLRARSPDGTGRWLFPNVPTPEAANSFAFRNEIVINEIMYNPKSLAPTNNQPPAPSPEEWIELHNRSGAPVDLTGWKLDGGIEYSFGPGQMIPAGGYLVVADDVNYLRSLYPSIAIVGNYNGRLSGRSDLLVLSDSAGNPADEVRYFDGGSWPAYADGGGSSLELRDPDADNSKPHAWAASDESNKTSWQTYTYRWTAVAPAVQQPARFNDFILGLLGDGECLIDDISVIESPAGTPVSFIENGDFESGLSGWRVLGTHNRSQVIVDPDNPGNHVLHVMATGAQEHMHNHVERNYIGGRRITETREYQISFRARWLAGNHLLNTRLYFNRFARTTALPYPALHGTPGVLNSRRESNIGPTFSELRHEPVVPEPGETVTVSALAQDPDGVASAQLFWSVDSGAFNPAPMTIQSNGHLVGTIPGYPARSVVQFYIRALDSLGAAANYPADGANSGALYGVAGGEARPQLGHNIRIVLSPANTALMHASTNVMSNHGLPCTVVYDERRAYYGASVRLKGSERGRDNPVRVSFHVTFPSEDLFRGVHPVMLIDRAPGGSRPAQEEVVIRHMLLRAGGIPAPNPDICWVIAPNSGHTGPAIFAPRFEDEFAETAFENGGDGTFFELELVYSPQGTNQFGYKLPQPDDVTTTVDFNDYGNDKENYRYNFIIKNHREEDDYSRFIPFAKMFSLSGTALEQQAAQLMDVEEWLRAYALVSLCGVGDMYTYGLPHNWMVHQRGSDGKFMYFPWDMDFSFTRGATDVLVGNSPADASRFNKIVNLPGNLRCYYAHLLDIINISFNVPYMTYWLDHYDNFAPPQNYTGDASYIQQRGDSVRSQIGSAGGNAAFVVSGPTTVTTNSSLVTFTGTAPVTMKTIRVNGKEYPITWTSVSAWRMLVPLSDATTVLEFVGHDIRGNPQTNLARTVTVHYTGPTPEPAGAIVINEIQYHPATRDTAFVELYNRSAFSFDLSDWRINGLDYTFPKGGVITNGQYLLLVNQMSAYAAAFGANAPPAFDEFPGNLQNDGETLTLFRPGPNAGEEIIVDKVKYEDVLPWSQAADGGGLSLQLIDAAEDNARVGNWRDSTGWRYFSYTGTISGGTSRGTNFIIYLAAAGEVHLDDMTLVIGTVPEAGPNLLVNGDFEEPLAGTWLSTNNHAGTERSTAVSHSGSGSLRVAATGAGSPTTSFVRQIIPGLSSPTQCTLSFWLLPVTNGPTLTIRTAPGANFNSPFPTQPVFSSPGAANTVVRDLPPFPDLYLNEVQPENISGPVDGQGEREPWIEIYNPGATTISLDGYYLANNYSNTTQWAFPAGSSIGTGEFKVIFADGEPGESTAHEWHTSFRPEPGNGSVALSSSTLVLDYLNYEEVRPNWSYGAYPDGQLFERQAFYRPTAAGTNDNTQPPITVFINEWMASNTRTLMNTNNNNRFDDWLELYNPTDFPADLTGYFLTDSVSNKFQFVIPSGYMVPAHGYLLVWADNETDLNNTNDAALHAGFRLERGGEQIALVDPDGGFVDSVTFEPQFSDVSQGRYPNGANAIYFLAGATPKAPNTSWINRYPALNEIPDQAALVDEPFSYQVVASDPDGHTLTYTLGAASPANAVIGSASGQFTWTPQAPGTNAVTVRVTDNGPLALSVTRTFDIVVTRGIRIGRITRVSGTELSITLSATAGKTYRAEYKNNLTDAEWTPIEPGTVAEGSTVAISIPLGSEPHRFFRVVQVD